MFLVGRSANSRNQRALVKCVGLTAADPEQEFRESGKDAGQGCLSLSVGKLLLRGRKRK